MKEIARSQRTGCLGVVLFIASTTSAACFRSPLGDSPSPLPDGAHQLDALHLAPAEADTPSDLRPDLAPGGEPPALAFATVSAGFSSACGVKTDSTIVCWGDNSWGESTPPAGTFASVSAGYFFACAVRTDGTIACWGATTRMARPRRRQVPSHPSVRAISLPAG